MTNPILNHTTDLTEYRTLRYLARLPICLAESGSLSLCTSHFLSLPSDPAVGQQRPCDSDYLPPGQGDSGIFQSDGFACFAGQTKKAARITPGSSHHISTSVESVYIAYPGNLRSRIIARFNRVFDIVDHNVSRCFKPHFAQAHSHPTCQV